MGGAVDDGVEFFIKQLFDFRREQSVGAYMLSKFTEPEAVDRRRDMSHLFVVRLCSAGSS